MTAASFKDFQKARSGRSGLFVFSAMLVFFSSAFALFAADELPQKIVAGTGATEGPSLNERGELFFADVSGNRLYRWRPEGLEVFLTGTGQAFGTAVDSEGRLVLCQSGARRISRLEKDGSLRVLAAEYEDQRFNRPNDVAVAADGTIYFTDPPQGALPASVYRIHPDLRVERIAADLRFPNGIALSRDGNMLYVADTENHEIRRYELKLDGRVTPYLPAIPAASPDGLAVTSDGHIYVAEFGARQVVLLSPDGQRRREIPIPEQRVRNCALSPDETVLYVTAGNAVYQVPLKNRSESHA